MPDTKITALTAIGANPIIPATFPIPMVDLTDTSMAASGTTKKVTVNQILGSGGTATLASATITGDLTVDTNVLAVNATTNAVGIGTTVAPAYSSKLRVEGGVEIHTSQALNIQPGNTNPYEIVNRSAGGFAFYPTGSALGMTLDASGNLSLANGNLVMGTSGKGIDFSATSGTGTSELLNDYEEGTWTPTDGSNAGLTFTVSNCRYTKVGRVVTIQGTVAYPVTVDGSNALWTGFPFAAADIIFLSVAYTDASIASFTYLSGVSNIVYLLTPGVNVINSTLSNKSITFFGTYMV